VAAAVVEEAVAEEEAVEEPAAAVEAAVCIQASAVQEPDPCDLRPANPAKKDIPNPSVQAAAEAAEAEADPEELYS
jgi:hypothetical protein